jgi:hypothetical protein
MTRAAGRLGSSTTGLILVVLAMVVVVIGLAAPAGAMAQYRPAETQAHIGDGAVQSDVTIYDSGCSSWSGAGEAGSCVYDDAATRADERAGDLPSSVSGVSATRATPSSYENWGGEFLDDGARMGPEQLPPRTGEAPASSFNRTETLSGRASSRNVSNIQASMEEGGWQGKPIKVVEHEGEMYVADGNHRVAAASRAGIDVRYQVVSPESVSGPGTWQGIQDIVEAAWNWRPDRLR